jgi:hypothetical protein
VAAGGYSKLRISPSYALKSINAWAGVFQKATYPHGIHMAIRTAPKNGGLHLTGQLWIQDD